MILRHAAGAVELDRCLVMGIVNRTPDSFYDGGRMDLDASIEHGLRLVEDGADILDIGAVKAGPGPPVSEADEIERLLPLVSELRASTDALVSVETSRPHIAKLAVGAGAAIVNDVEGLADQGIAEVCASTGAALVLMHNGGQVRGRPRHPRYADVVAEVGDELERLAARAQARGVPRDSLVLDPGLDFGKTTSHSLELVRRLDEVVARGYPIVMAPSRKDIVGETLGLPPADRLEGTLALVALSVLRGAAIVRVHDVSAAVRTVRMVEAVMGTKAPDRPVRGLWD